VISVLTFGRAYEARSDIVSMSECFKLPWGRRVDSRFLICVMKHLEQSELHCSSPALVSQPDCCFLFYTTFTRHRPRSLSCRDCSRYSSASCSLDACQLNPCLQTVHIRGSHDLRLSLRLRTSAQAVTTHVLHIPRHQLLNRSALITRALLEGIPLLDMRPGCSAYPRMPE
jgi:hypothetical protein